MSIQKGDVYLYEPPPITDDSPQGALLVQSGGEQAGLRPYVIVSRHLINQKGNTIVGVPLSKNISKANSYRIKLPTQFLIPEVDCKPFLDSVALCDHVRVLDVNRLRRKIGKVAQNAMYGVELGLAFVFDLPMA